jgi:hypothetical protein
MTQILHHNLPTDHLHLDKYCYLPDIGIPFPHLSGTYVVTEMKRLCSTSLTLCCLDRRLLQAASCLTIEHACLQFHHEAATLNEQHGKQVTKR